jgi:hypothetical protein
MRNVGFIGLLIITALLLAFAFPVAAAGPEKPIAPQVAALPAVPAIAAMPQEPHPHIHEALEAMRAAKGHLEAAVPEFHGHRAKAIEHLNQAIHEAEICEHER